MHIFRNTGIQCPAWRSYWRTQETKNKQYNDQETKNKQYNDQKTKNKQYNDQKDKEQTIQ